MFEGVGAKWQGGWKLGAWHLLGRGLLQVVVKAWAVKNPGFSYGSMPAGSATAVALDQSVERPRR